MIVYNLKQILGTFQTCFLLFLKIWLELAVIKGGIPENPGVGLLEQTDSDPGGHFPNPVAH